MRVFAALIEARMGAAKFVTRVRRNQTKVLVEFVPDKTAGYGNHAFPYRKSNTAMLDYGLRGLIELEQGFV